MEICLGTVRIQPIRIAAPIRSPEPRLNHRGPANIRSTGLNKQDTPVALFRKPGRNNAACGAAPDDDVIVRGFN
jgi:hypothetical protein